MRANVTNLEAKRQFSVRFKDVLMNYQAHHKFWPTLKAAVFWSSSSLPWLVGGLVFESVGEANLLSDHFDNKQTRESVDLPLICHHSPSLITFAFSLEMKPYGGTDPLGMFQLFLKELMMFWPVLV